MKKIAIRIFYILAIAILGFIIYRFIHYYQQLKSPIVPAICAIDKNAFAILEIKKSNSFLHFIENIDSIDNVNSNKENIYTLKKISEFISSQSLDISEQIQSLYLVFLLHKNQLQFLILFNATNNFQIKNIEEFICSQLSTSPATITEHYITSDIKKIRYKEPEQQLYFSISKGVFIISPNLEICKNAILQTYNQNNLSKNKTFRQLQESAGKHVEANLYLFYPKFIQYINLHKNPKLQSLTQYLSITQWSVFDICFNNNTIAFDGISTNETLNNDILKQFRNTSGIHNQAINIIPDNTIFYSIFSYQNSLILLENYSFNSSKKNTHTDSIIYQICNTKSPLQICEFITHNPFYSNDSTDIYIVIASPEIKEFQEKIQTLQKSNTVAGTTDSSCSEILKFIKIKNFFKNLSIPLQLQKDTIFGFNVDNFIVFGETKNNLIQIYRKYKYSQLLKNDTYFSEQYESIPENTNYQIYFNLTSWDKNKATNNSKKINSFIFNFVNHQEYFFSNGIINFNSHKEKQNKYYIHNDSLNPQHPIIIINKLIATVDQFQHLKIYNFLGKPIHNIYIKNVQPNNTTILNAKNNNQYLICQNEDSIFFISTTEHHYSIQAIKQKYLKNIRPFSDQENQSLFVISHNGINKYVISENNIEKSLIKYKFPFHSTAQIRHFTFDNQDYFFVKNNLDKYFILQPDGKTLPIPVQTSLLTFYQTSKNAMPEIFTLNKESEFAQYNFLSRQWETLCKINRNIKMPEFTLYHANNIWVASGNLLLIHNKKGELLKKIEFPAEIHLQFIPIYSNNEAPKNELTIIENDFCYLLNSQYEVASKFPVQCHQLLLYFDTDKKTRIITAGHNIIIEEN